MKRNAKLFALVSLSVLAGLILKSDRGHGQGAAGSQFPLVIKQVFLTNQTASLGPVTLFTPTSEGLYRVSAYADVTPSSNPGVVCGDLSWTDESGPETLSSLLLDFYGECAQANGNPGTSSILVHAKPNQPVTISISTYDSFAGQYNLFVTVEQL